MRIDQFLWYVRIFKSRTLATIHCKKRLIKVNDSFVKPSHQISPTNIIEVRKNQFWYKLKVLDFPTSRVSAKMVGLYCIGLNNQKDFNDLQLIKLQQSPHRLKGSGRPTKKERRRIDSMIEEQ